MKKCALLKIKLSAYMEFPHSIYKWEKLINKNGQSVSIVFFFNGNQLSLKSG